jgi:nitroimidazol reductase NimA-like FMN-containing flavoprotein (pyridoxamine 5'-phosphate oxidase superfamily)
VTLVDGLVLARSAFHHSINHRSVVAPGTATVVTDPAEKPAALTALVDAVVPGRSAGSREPDRRELAATTVLVLPLEEVSVKVRTGPPSDDVEDLGLPHWAGVLPLHTVPGPPEPAPDLTPGIDVPPHVSGWSR